MSGVRVLVGTRKGAFVLTSDGKRERWDVSGPHFAGWEIYHLEGLAGRPEPAVRVAVQRLVRAGDPALQRRRQDLGAGRQQVRVRRRARHAPVVRRHAAPLGVQARLASRTVADRSRTRSTPESKTPPCSARPTAARRGRSSPACAATARAPTGSRAPAGCACTRSCSIRANPGRIFIAISAAGAFRTDDGGKTWRPINRACSPQASPTRMPRSATASIASRCTRRGPTCCSCRSTGTSCAATTPASRGTRSAATCRPTSASRSTCMRTSRRPSTSSRSRATPSTFRPTASCACTAAARAATSGRRSPKACRSRTATSTSARRDGRRLARSVRRLLRHHRRAGVRVGRLGDTWAPIVRDLPPVLSVEVQTLP